MNLEMGTQRFIDVEVPLLWGDRAVIQDTEGALSVIDLGQDTARLEVLADEPAPGVEFRPEEDGFTVLSSGQASYSYAPATKTLTSASPGLPDVQILPTETRVGSSVFSGNVFAGVGVGIRVTERGMEIGAPLPPGLAKLVV